MTRIHLIIAAFAATAVGASPAFSAPLKEAGPWDLLLIQQKSEEGLRLAVREGHTAFCARYIDNVKAPTPSEQRYSAYLYPVTTPAECLASKRALGQVECIYR